VERTVTPRLPLTQTEGAEPDADSAAPAGKPEPAADVPTPEPAPEPAPTSANATEAGFPVHRMPPARRPAPRAPGTTAGVPAQQPAADQAAGVAPLIEFTRPERDTAEWPTLSGRGYRSARPDPVRRRGPRPTRNPVVGLVAMLVFAFAAAFFAWDSASPIWLALGHERSGVATVANCPVHGLAERCAEFTANDRSFTATVRLAGPASADASTGQHLAAEMVSRSGNVAYAGDQRSLYLGWVPGVLLLLLCGLGIAWATGARRLAGRRARILAVLGSFAGPLLLLVGMLAATW
jgi:hypothetical protein